MKSVADAGLLKGRTVGIDATTLEANAALRSILRRDAGEGYCGRRRRRYHSKRALNSA